MSLIYEALEKVEQEKKGSKAPSEKVAPSEKEKNRLSTDSKPIYWIGGGLLFLFILGTVYLTTRSSHPPTLPSPSFVTVPTENGKFSLTGITGAGADMTAIINNQLVRVGDWVSGARVTAIGSREVTLEYKGETFTKKLY